ncbi:RNA exonuclease 5 [Nasonia vitripennis]|uniref:Exonuclease domain-containing protein n=1 Tax=Nasonia vitripennis TaxID=7425 RepID=A0A7M7GD05_NASVI|nr:RNA exonuclease 5 [Nasonia vitripennis]
MSDEPLTKKPKLSGEEFAQLKEKLKERKKRLTAIPRIRLLAVGESASLCDTISEEDRIPIFLGDVQRLLVYSMLGHHAPYSPERWIKLDKYNKVSHTVVFIVEGLSINHYVTNESAFKHLTSNLEHKLELITPSSYGGSVVDELAAVPLTGTQKAKLLKKFGSMEEAMKSSGDIIKLFRTIFPMQPVVKKDTDADKDIQLPPTDKFSRTELILSPWQLVEENYPIPLKGGLAKKYDDYVLTKDEYVEVNSKSPMYGLDCEMCRTTSGFLELTRISIVDEKLNIVYDTLVMPDNKIVDYLTRFSGITEKMLENVNVKLADVQKFLRAFLPPDAILVGQSLNSDLHALRMMHPYVIDTSVIFNLTGDRFRKTKLKVLSEAFLNERIQTGKAGHCSTEDSQASMKLVQLKLLHSIHFGDSVLIDQSYIDSYETKIKEDKKSVRLKQDETCTLSSLIFKHVTKVDQKTAAIFGCNEVMNDYSKILKNSSLNIMEDKHFDKGDNVRLVIADSNKEAITRCSQIAMEHALNFCHIKLNEEQLSEEKLPKTLNSVDKWVKKLWQHTALHGLVCVIFSGEKNSSNGACFLNIKKNIEELNGDST